MKSLVIRGASYGLAAFLLLMASGPRARAQGLHLSPLAKAELGDHSLASINADNIQASVKVETVSGCRTLKTLWDTNGETQAASCPVATLTITDKQHPDIPASVTRLTTYDADHRGVMGLTLSMWQLDPTNDRPQVMVSAFTGGAHCCEVTTIFSRATDGTWRHVNMGMRNGGEPFPVMAMGRNSTPVLVTSDDRFLYTFSSYAGSYAPLVIQSLRDNALTDVTRDPAFHDDIVRSLAERRQEWIKDGRNEPNGFLAGYVASSATVGNLIPAWKTMLREQDSKSDPTFAMSRCTLKNLLSTKGNQPCTDEENKPLPFPVALSAFLVQTSYITETQARALPLTADASAAETSPSTPRAEAPSQQKPDGDSVQSYSTTLTNKQATTVFGIALGFFVLIAIGGTVLYFLPFIIGCARGATGLLSIFLVNFFLGVTLIGWIGALIMALCFESRRSYDQRLIDYGAGRRDRP